MSPIICAFCHAIIPESVIKQHLLIVHGYTEPDGREPSYIEPCCGSRVQGQHIDCHNASEPDGGKA